MLNHLQNVFSLGFNKKSYKFADLFWKFWPEAVLPANIDTIKMHRFFSNTYSNIFILIKLCKNTLL